MVKRRTDDPVDAAAAALEKLATTPEQAKYARQIRRLLPQIEAAIERGATHAMIVQALQENDILVNLNTFRSALYRARKQREKTQGNDRQAQNNSSHTEREASKPKRFEWDPTKKLDIKFSKDDEDNT